MGGGAAGFANQRLLRRHIDEAGEEEGLTRR